MNTAGSQPERRASARTETGRQVLFFGAHASLPREGWVVNIGLSGVAIVTTTPAPLGTQVDLEIQPKRESPGSEAIFVRGDVVRVDPDGGRRYVMAVHLRVAPPDARTYEPAGVEIHALIAETRTELRAMVPGTPLVAVDAFHSQENVPANVEEPPTRTRRKRRYLLLALLLLLMVPAWRVWHSWYASHAPQHATTRNDALRYRTNDMSLPTPAIQLSDMIARATPATPVERISDMTSSPPIAPLDFVPDATVSISEPVASVHALLALGQSSAAAGDWASATDALTRVADRDSASPAERVQARMGLALAAWVQGDRDKAAEDLAAAAAAAEGADPVWQESVATMSAALGGGKGTPGDYMVVDIIELESTDAPTPAVGSKRHLIVDKSDFVVRVMQGAGELRRFPVGLGFNGATPTGDFVVANMIENPTWFNRGEAVPPDDPRNPLGSRWMGLGRGGVTTPYGIHGTEELESIGSEMSRGCIRMVSGDAEALFALCSVGTPVSIVP